MVRIGGFVDVSTIDCPGRVSSVVFFAGCNFSCPYCQNRHLVPMDSGKDLTVKQVESWLMSTRELVDTLVVSGGEPLLQPDGLRQVLQLARSRGLQTALQTNGSKHEVLRSLLEVGLLDHVAIDFKTSPGRYSEVGGAAPLESIAIAYSYDIELEIRTTFDPRLVSDRDLGRIADYIPEGITWRKQEVKESS